jgi:hypothetical protein
MPQFDLFIWISLSYITLTFFHGIYLLCVYFILPQIAYLQKTLIKLNILKNKKQIEIKKNPKFSLLEFFVKIYLQNNKNNLKKK